LSGHTGNVVRWEFSTNNGSSWNTISNTGITESWSNLSQTRKYRALVQSGTCPAVYSSVATITVNSNAIGGTLNGSTTHCINVNQGVLSLTGNSGSIIRWERSTDNGITWRIIRVAGIIYTGTSFNYSNLSVTTRYRVLVGGCTNAYSSIATVTIGCNNLSSSTISTTPFVDPHGVTGTTVQTVTLDATVMPNPSTSYFTLKVASSSNDKVEVRVFDLAGNNLEKLTGLPGESIRFGDKLKQGLYIVKISQGSNQKTLRVIKL
jgi:hypothetical protein